MSRCRNGHDSSTDDYCDVCGVPMAGASAPPPAATELPSATTPCGNCDQPMLDGARFCERCGWDAEAASLGGDPTPPGPPPLSSPKSGAGQVVAAADRVYFDMVMAMAGEDASRLTFPAYWPERRFPVAGPRVLIGRRSRSRGTDPDLDLSGQVADPGVSHLHAMLERRRDGTWVVVDLGSSNGTYLNGATEPIEPQVPVPVGDGDRIHVGAWTTLTLHVLS